ncbi:uncharacterized protein LOC131205517 [Anopheles bellator]|uniref:uncharacterized protein LOC131205517 n=1 Tax=Anopheles bellator TaxID=139047 RepID=UPI002649B0C9|nr:uncharacterized protein LOC131205517 [Anopheles bellator]
MDQYYSDSEPEEDQEVTEQQRLTVVDLVRHMMLITEQSPENGPEMLQQLMCLLRPFFPGMPRGMPRDPLSALKGLTESWDIVYTVMGDGVYWHRGLEAGIRANMANDTTKVMFDIHISATPLPQRTNPSLVTWTILGRLHEGTKPPGDPFAVGVFCGNSVPSFVDFLHQVCEEAQHLCNRYNEQHILLTIKPRVVMADATARAYIKGTIPECDLYGCIKCCIKGEFLQEYNLTSFFNGTTPTPPRTHDFFIRGHYDATHRVSQQPMTPLARLPIDVIRDVIVGDNRHLLHIGIAKTLFFGYAEGYGRLNAMEAHLIPSLENALFNVRFPHERKPRQFGQYVSFWSHTMWGHFLDIVGIIVLKPLIRPEYYENYSKLHWAVALCSHKRYTRFLPYARVLLEDFVTEQENMVGHLTSTFHYLLHLVDEVERFGPLALQSTYPFEEELGVLKHKVDLERAAHPVQQIARALLLREAAQRCHQFADPVLFPIVSNRGLRVEIRKNFLLRDISAEGNDLNSWFLVPGPFNDGQVVLFDGATKDPFAVFGYPLSQQRALHVHPVQVPIGLNTYDTYDKTNLQAREKFQLKDMICKLCLIPVGISGAAFVPLTESFAEEP